MQEPRLPDVIGLGTRRSGSTWLHRALSAHPDIFKTDRGMHYFSDHLEKPIAWYTDQFRGAPKNAKCVDFSISYLLPPTNERSASGIVKALPDTKLFAILRHPIERAYSDFQRSIRLCELQVNCTFEDGLQRDPQFKKRGNYAHLLKPYLKHFQRDQLLLLFYEDLENSPDQFLKELFKFIGVRGSNDILKEMPPRNEKPSTVKYQGINSATLGSKKFADQAMHKIGLDLPWRILKKKLHTFYRAVFLLNSKVPEKNTTQTL